MFLAGLEVPDRLVLELAQLPPRGGLVGSAETLEDAYDSQREFVCSRSATARRSFGHSRLSLRVVRTPRRAQLEHAGGSTAGWSVTPHPKPDRTARLPAASSHRLHSASSNLT